MKSVLIIWLFLTTNDIVEILGENQEEATI